MVKYFETEFLEVYLGPEHDDGIEETREKEHKQRILSSLKRHLENTCFTVIETIRETNSRQCTC